MEAGLEQCLAFVRCQLQPAHIGKLATNGRQRWRAVTISRQAGTGGSAVAQELAKYLQLRAPDSACPWTVFDRDLVERVLQDHHLPSRLARFMPENHVSEIEDVLDELLGVHPPTEDLVRKTAETILHLAELGNVILIGRGATVITGKMHRVFHVRLVGSLERRAAQIQDRQGIGKKAAFKFMRAEDRGRRAYLKKYYHADVDDPLLYHITINTDLVGCGQAAEIIGKVVLSGAVSHTAKGFLEETSK